jgi:hypothetical protein
MENKTEAAAVQKAKVTKVAEQERTAMLVAEKLASNAKATLEAKDMDANRQVNVRETDTSNAKEEAEEFKSEVKETHETLGKDQEKKEMGVKSSEKSAKDAQQMKKQADKQMVKVQAQAKLDQAKAREKLQVADKEVQAAEEKAALAEQKAQNAKAVSSQLLGASKAAKQEKVTADIKYKEKALAATKAAIEPVKAALKLKLASKAVAEATEAKASKAKIAKLQGEQKKALKDQKLVMDQNTVAQHFKQKADKARQAAAQSASAANRLYMHVKDKEQSAVDASKEAADKVKAANKVKSAAVLYQSNALKKKRNDLKEANAQLEAAERGDKVASKEAAEERSSKLRVEKKKAYLRKVQMKQEKAESSVEYMLKSKQQAVDHLKAVQKETQESTQKFSKQASALKDESDKLAVDRDQEFAAARQAVAANTKQMMSATADAVVRSIEDLEEKISDMQNKVKEHENVQNAAEKLANKAQKQELVYKGKVEKDKGLLKSPFFIDGSKFVMKDNAAVCGRADGETELGESAELDSHKAAGTSLQCRHDFSETQFTVSNPQNEGHNRGEFHIGMKAPGAGWCRGTESSIVCNQEKVGSSEKFKFIPVSRRRGNASGKWRVSSNGRYCVQAQTAIECKLRSQDKRKATKFTVKCMVGCGKYKRLYESDYVKEKFYAHQVSKHTKEATDEEQQLKHVDQREVTFAKAELKKLKSHKTMLDEAHAAKLLHLQEVKKEFRLKTREEYEAKRDSVKASEEQTAEGNRIKAAKETVEKASAGKRKAQAKKVQTIETYREKSRKDTIKEMQEAAAVVEKRAESIKKLYKQMHEMRLAQVARADQGITQTRKDVDDAKLRNTAAIQKYQAAKKAQAESQAIQKSANEQMALSKATKDKAQIEATQILEKTATERTSELKEKSTLARDQMETAANALAVAEKAKVTAAKKMEESHAQASEAAKLAAAAVKRCHIAKERRSKARLKMRPSVWEKLEAASKKP